MNNRIVLPTVSSEDISRMPDQASYKINLAIDEIETMWDTIYPVGTYYENSDQNFDPEEAWGGDWEEVSTGRWHRVA